MKKAAAFIGRHVRESVPRWPIKREDELLAPKPVSAAQKVDHPMDGARLDFLAKRKQRRIEP